MRRIEVETKGARTMKRTKIATVCVLSACGWILLIAGQWQAAIPVFSLATVIELA
jgi:hypothetical protein